MGSPDVPDPLAAAIRAMVASEQQALFDRVIAGIGEAAGAAV